MSNISIQYQNDIELIEISINQWLDDQGIEWADPEEKMESYYQKKKQDIFSVKVDLENSDIIENQLTFDNIEQIDSQWEINQYQYELSDQVQFAKSERCVGTNNYNSKNTYDLAMQSSMGDSIVEVRKRGLENNDNNRELSDFNEFSENFNGLSLNESCVKKTNSFSLNKSQMNNSCGINNINTNLQSNNSQNSQNNLKGIFNSPLMQRRMSMGQNKVNQMPRLSFSSLCGQKFSKFERQSQINKKNTNNYDNDKSNNKNYIEVLENQFDKKVQLQDTSENY